MKKEEESNWSDGIIKIKSQDLSERLPGVVGKKQDNSETLESL